MTVKQIRIRSKGDYERLVQNLKKQAPEVHGTYEETGVMIDFVGYTSDVMAEFGISKDFETELVQALSCFKKTKVGPYITEKYLGLIPGIKDAAMQTVFDNPYSRRCIVKFEDGHCFSTMQFLYRGGAIQVQCFMRSCDAINNLPYDLWLCMKAADIFATEFSRVNPRLKVYSYRTVNMTFGSLHAYKEDF